MPKFRKKPVVVEAHLHVDNKSTVEWMETFVGKGKAPVHAQPILGIHTLEGVMYVSLGDWVIRGVQGEFYPCKPDIFEATYEEVTE